MPRPKSLTKPANRAPLFVGVHSHSKLKGASMRPPQESNPWSHNAGAHFFFSLANISIDEHLLAVLRGIAVVSVQFTASVCLHPRPFRACAEPRRASARRGEHPLVWVNMSRTQSVLRTLAWNFVQTYALQHLEAARQGKIWKTLFSFYRKRLTVMDLFEGLWLVGTHFRR